MGEFATAIGITDRDSKAVLSALRCPTRDTDSAVMSQSSPYDDVHEDLPLSDASDHKLRGLLALDRTDGSQPANTLPVICPLLSTLRGSCDLLSLSAIRKGEQYEEDRYSADEHDGEAQVAFASFTHSAAESEPSSRGHQITSDPALPRTLDDDPKTGPPSASGILGSWTAALPR